jgi:hypothetical protein
MLPRPWKWFSRRTLRCVIATAIGIVDGKRWLSNTAIRGPTDGVTLPVLSSFALDDAFIELHRVASRVNDENATLSQWLDIGLRICTSEYPTCRR